MIAVTVIAGGARRRLDCGMQITQRPGFYMEAHPWLLSDLERFLEMPDDVCAWALNEMREKGTIPTHTEMVSRATRPARRRALRVIRGGKL